MDQMAIHMYPKKITISIFRTEYVRSLIENIIFYTNKVHNIKTYNLNI